MFLGVQYARYVYRTSKYGGYMASSSTGNPNAEEFAYDLEPASCVLTDVI